MQQYDQAFRKAASKLATAATKTMNDLASAVLPDEPNATSSLVTRFKDALDGKDIAGIHWTAKVLSPQMEEPFFGADFVGVLNLDLRGYRIAKGFFAQAKRQEPGHALPTDKWRKLQEQCRKMLNYSPASYVFVYSLNGVFAVPAITIAACAGRADLHTMHPKPMSAFYSDHFRCFVGDRRISAPTIDVLDGLPYSGGLELKGRPSSTSNKSLHPTASGGG